MTPDPDPIASTDREIELALAALGDDAEKVADALKAAGVVGDRHDHYTCPVACYLAERFPGHRFGVDLYRAEIDGEGRIVLPVAVSLFVAFFDDGVYPELVRKRTPARENLECP